MHTVFFGENDYTHAESLLKGGSQEIATCDNDRKNNDNISDASSNKTNAPFKALEEIFFEKSSLDMDKNLQIISDFEDKDVIITNLSDACKGLDTQKSMFTLEKIKCMDEESNKSEHVCKEMKSNQEKFDVFPTQGKFIENFDNFNQESQNCHIQAIQVETNPQQDIKTNGELKQIPTLEVPKISIDIEFIKVNDDINDDHDFQSHKDLFSESFYKLVVNRKVRYKYIVILQC